MTRTPSRTKIARMSINAEIITTGTELLLGELVDTNSPYIARRLRTIGVNLFHIISVGDNQERMARVLRQALERSDVIITTGGLGPTVDDVTREAVAEATGRTLVLNESLLAQIEARFNRWGRNMTANNRRQAYLPSGSTPVENPVGTAPCFIVEEKQGTIISLPGVPREMEYLIEHSVIPYLRQRFDLTEVIKAKVLKTCAIGESTIDDMLTDVMKSANPTVGLAAHPAQTDVRITAKAPGEEEADRMIAETETLIRQRLGDVIYGVDRQRLEDVVVDILSRHDVSVAVLESMTRGAVARRLGSAMNGRDLLKSSSTLSAASGAFQNELAGLLDIPPAELEQIGLASERVAVLAAQAIRRVSGADFGLVVLGIGQVDEASYAPVDGCVWGALSGPDGTTTRPFRYGGESDTFVPWISGMALDLLRRGVLGRAKQQPEF